MAEHHIKGGRARAAALTGAERAGIASKAAKARWDRDPELSFLSAAASALAAMEPDSRLRVFQYLKSKFPKEWPSDSY